MREKSWECDKREREEAAGPDGHEDENVDENGAALPG
jgi:hypothetical protein